MSRDDLASPEPPVFLLPCPFCGGEAGISEGLHFWIECRKCGASSAHHVLSAPGIEKWNARVLPKDAPIGAGST